MKLFAFSHSALTNTKCFLQQNSKVLMIPTIVCSCLTLAAILLNNITYQAPSPVNLQKLKGVTSQQTSPCRNSSLELIVNLGTLYRPSRHCLLYCMHKRTFAVFDCHDTTKYWTKQALHILNSTEIVTKELFQHNCTGFYYTELCRIPTVVQALL